MLLIIRMERMSEALKEKCTSSLSGVNKVLDERCLIKLNFILITCPYTETNSISFLTKTKTLIIIVV